ncbi:hypothetical protein B4U79_14531 [Dinothrombium tinctorium]|nr:hypothetical protein B4U79_14531 [Dinothrombium tinctorium]
MNTLSELRKFAKYPSVINALKNDRVSLLKKVDDWAENSAMLENTENYSLVDQIGFLKAREGKLKAVIKVCDTLFQDIAEYPQHKSNFEALVKELSNHSSTLFREWCEDSRRIKLDPKKPCIEIEESTQIPIVTFDPKLVKLTQECRALRCFGFALPSEIVESEEVIKKYGFIARELREIVNFYCTIGDQILLSQRPMLIDGAKAFTSLLESKDKISWDKEPLKLRAWLDELKDFSKSFSAENRSLRRKHQNILQRVETFFDIPTAKWASSLNEIRTIMHEVDSKYPNTNSWKKHWDHQLYKILEHHFSEALIKSENLLALRGEGHIGSLTTGSLKVDLCFEFDSVSFRPSFEEIKAKIYAKIKKFLSIPVTFQGFADYKSSDSIFHSIYLRSFNSFPLLYTKAEQILSELKTIRIKFIEWTSIYQILQTYNNSTSTLSSFLKLDSLIDYKNNLMIIKAKSQKFNREYVENELVCKNSNIVVNLIPIKMFVDWLYVEIDKLLVKSLKDETEKLANELNSQLEDVIKQLTDCPKTIEELLHVENLTNGELFTIQSSINSKYTEFEERYSFLMKWSAKSAPNLSNVINQYDDFERIFGNRHSILSSFRELMKSKLETNVGSIKLEIEQFSEKWTKASAAMKDDKEFVAEIMNECNNLSQDFEQVEKSCDYFNFKKPEIFEEFKFLRKEIEEVDIKLNLANSFEAGFSTFFEMEWIVSRNKLNAIENYLSQWEEENPNCGPIIKTKIEEWREFLSILKFCRGECFVKSHWDEFLSLLGLHREVTFDSLKLSHLVSRRRAIFENKEQIKELNARSVGEMSVRETFNELDSFAANSTFELYDYRTSLGDNLKLIKSWRNVMNQVSEATLSLQSLKMSEYFSNEFAEKRVQWEERLASLDSIVASLNSVQRKWTYLEPIFTKNQSPGVFLDNSFAKTSSDFQDLMKTIANDSHLVRLLRIPNIEARLRDIDAVFNSCQKKLNVFMERSRNRFPRFYFLADDDLLLVLAGKTEISQAGLLKKLFNNAVSKIQFNGTTITAIESPEGEVVKLLGEVAIEADEGAAGVEKWLKSLETEIKSSLKHLLFNAIKSGMSFDSIAWDLPSQILSLIFFILFTTKTEEAIKMNKILELKQELGKILIYFTEQEGKYNDIILKIKIKSLTLDIIHFLSVVDELLEQNVDNIENWFWQKQLRYYANRREEIVEVKMGSATAKYSFEYLGTYGVSKLVHTPLTDKCYLICMEAMAMGLGGNPYGPAGTGKTESVKALGQQLGRQVLVFNCDEAIDMKSMIRILIGLIKCGFWGCFDEFNRLPIDVLSALSSQIQAIQNALKSSQKNVLLFDEEIEIDPNSGLFVTLNPVGKQYKGRNRLPDNLKALFLPISMTIPDSAIISKVLLLAEGFNLKSSEEIGNKITSWFELNKFSMSQQKHYDWGLRAIKSCLLSSGRILRNDSNKNEILSVVSALRKQIKSKLLQEDEYKFEELVKDVFGQSFLLENENTSNDTFRNKIIEVFDKRNLIVDEIQITKIIEFDEQLQSRLGVVLLGETGVGKSTVWKVLMEVKFLMENITIIPIVMNPKSVSRSQLLGYVDEDTREWQDGIFTSKSREVSRDESSNKFWLIFDGDIDPEWVEALNSVLDDNKVLTLPSGERIDFDAAKVNIIFETNSLKFASPATVSRLGVVSIADVKANHLITSRLKGLNIPAESIEKIHQFVVSAKSELQISRAKTIFARLKFAIENKKDFQQLLETTKVQQVDPYKNGSIVITKSIFYTINFISSLIDESIVLIGDKGVGKHAILSETVMKTGSVITVNCHPKIMPHEIIQKLHEACGIVHLGSHKMLKTNNGSKIILYVRHLELIEMDKWQSKYLIAFLTSLINYKGFYDETTLDWIQVDNFQVVATCTNLSFLESKFLSLVHIIDVTLPTFDEIQMMLELSCPENAPWKSTFASSAVKVMNEVKNSSISCDFLRNSMRSIDCLSRYDQVNNEVLAKEFFRGFQHEIAEKSKFFKELISASFNTFKFDENLYTCQNFGSKLAIQEMNEFSTFVRKSISLWINENEALIPKIVLTCEFLELFSEVATFLSDSCEGVKGLVLTGHSGSGRKLSVKVLTLYFGYDLLWIPKSSSEKQLTSDLNSLLQMEETEAKKKIVILVDELHFKLISCLLPKIYNILHAPQKSTVKVVITMSSLNKTDDLMWGRVCLVYRSKPLTNMSEINIAKTFTEYEKDESFYAQFPEISQVSKHFANDSRRYLAFIDTYKTLLSTKTSNLDEKRRHLMKGVSKLEEVSKEVEKLKEEAKKQQNVLAAKRQEADDALDLITTSMKASEGQKSELEDIKIRTEKETAKLKIRKQEIDAELKEIEPTLLAAKAAVGGIKPEALSEIRSLRAPPEVIRDILEGVLRLMGVNDTSWVSMKSFLSRRGVKEEIMNFDARKITPEMRAKVETLLKAKPESFEEQQAKRASAAAAPLAIWLKANVTYSKVLHKIKPLEDEQNRLEAGLKSAQNRMKSLTGELQGVEIEVGNLRNRLNQVTVEAAQIEINLKQTTSNLVKSESLIEELSGEFIRWKEQLSELNEEFDYLPQKCLVAAAYTNFAGIKSSSEERTKLLKKFIKIAKLDEFDLSKFFDCELEDDAFISMQSSFLTTLIVDPSRKFLAKFSNSEIMDLSKQDWQRVLELSLRFGKTVIVDGFNQLNLVLLSILRHEVFGTEGSRQWVFLGEKRVDFNPNFRLFLLASDVSLDVANTSLINIVSMAPSNSSIAAMLLSIIIEIRRPELEQRKAELEKSNKALAIKLSKLESELLHKLSSSTGNILDNDELIASLREIKKSTKEIESSLKQSASVAEDLNRERAQYENLAHFASNLYFQIRELSHLNNMYRFGIHEYQNLFTKCLKENKDLSNGKLLQYVYDYVSQGLFPEDKTILKRFLESQYSEKLVFESVNLNSFFKSIDLKNKFKLMLIITSAGSDPSSEIQEVVQELKISDCYFLSMGSNYIEKAESKLSAEQPTFVCLTNIHFVINWLSKLSKILTNLSEQLKEKYIVLVSECHDEFPSSLLEICTKFVYESTPGLKAHVKNLDTDPKLRSLVEINKVRYFHAICCERKHFIPIGWTKSYEFGFNDFRFAVQTIENVKKTKNRRTQSAFISGLLENVIYGGKIDSKVDFRILQSLIKQWFSNLESKIEKDLQHKSEASVLGLPPNINLWKNAFVEEKLSKGLQVLEKAASVVQKKEEMKVLQQLWRETGMKHLIDKSSPMRASKSSPLTSFLHSEWNKLITLIKLIEVDLENPNEETYNALKHNQTPDSWLAFWETAPEDAEKFMRRLSEVCGELRKNMQSLEMKSYSLGNFLSVSSFLNALKQHAAREIGISVDSIKMHFNWSRNVAKTTQLFMATITGLNIEGAVFDGVSLMECSPNAELKSAMPPLNLCFTPKESQFLSEGETVELPVFGTSSRDNVLFWFDVPCKPGSQSYWIQSAIGLVVKE